MIPREGRDTFGHHTHPTCRARRTFASRCCRKAVSRSACRPLHPNRRPSPTSFRYSSRKCAFAFRNARSPGTRALGRSGSCIRGAIGNCRRRSDSLRRRKSGSHWGHTDPPPRRCPSRPNCLCSDCRLGFACRNCRTLGCWRRGKSECRSPNDNRPRTIGSRCCRMPPSCWASTRPPSRRWTTVTRSHCCRCGFACRTCRRKTASAVRRMVDRCKGPIGNCRHRFAFRGPRTFACCWARKPPAFRRLTNRTTSHCCRRGPVFRSCRKLRSPDRYRVQKYIDPSGNPRRRTVSLLRRRRTFGSHWARIRPGFRKPTNRTTSRCYKIETAFHNCRTLGLAVLRRLGCKHPIGSCHCTLVCRRCRKLRCCSVRRCLGRCSRTSPTICRSNTFAPAFRNSDMIVSEGLDTARLDMAPTGNCRHKLPSPPCRMFERHWVRTLLRRDNSTRATTRRCCTCGSRFRISCRTPSN
jgi:hypothetical protein